MRKNALIALLAVSAFIVFGYYAFQTAEASGPPSADQDMRAFPFATLRDRQGDLAQGTEWQLVRQKYDDLVARIRHDPNDLKAKLLLAQTYIQEARITGEHPYYYPATLAILDDVLGREPRSFEALAFKGLILLSQHRFAEALEVGKRSLAINSNNGFIYGVMVDANVELGRYEDALKASDTMQALKPGLEAYARASYLREIYGDNPGSIEAMQMAAKAGYPGSEQAAWTRKTLGDLYRQTGQLDKAQREYETVLAQRPSYGFAMAGLAAVARARGKADEALKILEKAAASMPEFSFYEDMADIYAAKGQADKARELYQKVMGMLEEDAASGHYTDLEMAEVYLKLGDKDKALQHAQAEYARRPENIDVNKTMAWVRYQRGELAEANAALQKALRTGSKNAELLCRAGIILAAAGDKVQGTRYVRQAFEINPYLTEDLATPARPLR